MKRQKQITLDKTEGTKITITLAPQTEAKLKEMARCKGRDENTLADALLAEVLEAADHDFEESCEAIAESLATDPNQDVSLEMYQAQFKAEQEARRSKHTTRKTKWRHERGNAPYLCRALYSACCRRH